MSTQFATPTFGGKRKVTAYYDTVNSMIRKLRPVASLRTIANHLNQAGILTPAELTWDRDRLSNYLRTTSI